MSREGQAKDVVAALLQAADDANPQVKASVAKACTDMAERKPELVLSTAMMFLTDKMPVQDVSPPTSPASVQQGGESHVALHTHRVAILRIMAEVILQTNELPSRLVENLAKFAVTEITFFKDVIPDWQSAASAVLVALGQRHTGVVLDCILSKFELGDIPHYFLLRALGDLASRQTLVFVPRLREILAKMLPVAALIKTNPLKWVFAYAMGRFCEAVVSYQALNEAHGGTLPHTVFHSEVVTAYEIMFNQWLIRGDPKVRLGTAEALGFMCHCLSAEQLETQLPRLLPGVLSMYKREKENDRLPITLGLVQILDVALREHRLVTEPLLPTVLSSLHPIACVAPSFDDHMSVRNYNEVIRCFELVGRYFTNELLGFLRMRLEQKEPIGRATSLNILRHLISRLSVELEGKKGLVVSSMTPLVNDQSLRVRKAFAQVVFTMASQGYVHLAGGQTLIQDIVRQCAIPENDVKKFAEAQAKKRIPESAVSPLEVRTMCEQMLERMAANTEMEMLLWPFLFESLEPTEFTNAVPIVCKVLHTLGMRKKEQHDPDFHIDFANEVNLPRPPSILARLLVLLEPAWERPRAGVFILECLELLGPILHPSFPVEQTTLLLGLLKESNESDLSQYVWEDTLIEFFSKLLDTIGGETAVGELASTLTKHISLYTNMPALRRITYKYIGFSLQRLRTKEFIRQSLNAIFGATNHTNDLERQGCAQAFGFTACEHLDIAIEKLQHALREEAIRRATGFMGLIKDKTEADVDNMRGTIVLAFGYTAAGASQILLPSRVEQHIVGPIMSIISGAKTVQLRECLVRAVDMIGRSMHVSRLEASVSFMQRDDLINHILRFLSTKDTTQITTMRVLGLNACTTLINLEPPLSEEMQTMVLQNLHKYYELPVCHDDLDTMVHTNVNALLESLLFMEPVAATLAKLFKDIEQFAASSAEHTRERACTSFLILVRKFLEIHTGTGELPHRAVVLEGIGHMLAVIIPRCGDSSPYIREIAVDCAETLLAIYVHVSSHDASVGPTLTKQFVKIRGGIGTAVPASLTEVIRELVRTITRTLDIRDVGETVVDLLNGLEDPDAGSVECVHTALSAILKDRGGELKEKISDIVSHMMNILPKVTKGDAVRGTMRSLVEFARHYFEGIVEELLETELPIPSHRIEALQTLASDSSLGVALVDHITTLLNSSPLYERVVGEDGEEEKRPCKQGEVATSALGEIFTVDGVEEALRSRFSPILCCLLLRVGAIMQLGDYDGSICASETFRRFIECFGERTVVAALDEELGTTTFAFQDQAVRVVRKIISSLAVSRMNEMERVYSILLPYSTGGYVGHKVIAMTVYAELVGCCKRGSPVLDLLLGVILSRIGDEEEGVRVQGYRGLGNLAGPEGVEHLSKNASQVLSALVSGVEDRSEKAAEEAIHSLSTVIDHVNEDVIASLVINMCVRLRKSFEKSRTSLRASAVTLLPRLGLFASSCQGPFIEQIQNGLPSLVMHVLDEEEDVREACRNALIALGPHLGGDSLCDLFQDHLGQRRVEYDAFLKAFSEFMITNFPDRLDFLFRCATQFFQSQWPIIKANAAIFSGYTLSRMTPELRKRVNTRDVRDEMIHLLKDANATVRAKTARALSLLSDY